MDTPIISGIKTTVRFQELISEGLKQPLPGVEAQMKMAPTAKIHDIFHHHPDRKPIKSSVLILCYERHDELVVLLIRRPVYPGIHSGQMAFPGGRYEAEDQNNEVTALRETEEETGLPRDNITLVGALTPLYIPPSNYIVYPYIGITEPNPDFVPDPEEVAAIIEIPVHQLTAPETVRLLPPSPEFSFLEVPAYVVDGVVIWGATAMIASEFIEILKKSIQVN